VADPFVDFVAAQLDGVEGLACLAMFGSHGLYNGQSLVGIVSRDRLYLRLGAAGAAACGRSDVKPYRSDHEVLRTFLEVPPDVLRDRERLARMARVALRSAAAPGPARSGPPATEAPQHAIHRPFL
jgi:TfoX/Sxy family transcriptional regulator of competence genes